MQMRRSWKRQHWGAQPPFSLLLLDLSCLSPSTGICMGEVMRRASTAQKKGSLPLKKAAGRRGVSSVSRLSPPLILGLGQILLLVSGA